MNFNFEEMIMDAIEIEDEQDREVVFNFLKAFKQKNSQKFQPEDPFNARRDNKQWSGIE